MSFSEWLTNVIKGTLAILRKGSSFGRFRLLRAYLRIELKRKFIVDLFHQNLKNETFWGHTIYFSDYTSFATLFEQVFVSDDYFFRTDNPKPRVIDCGANIGMAVAYVLTHYPQAHVLAFEADPANYEILLVNRDRNNWHNVEVFNLALAGKQGVMSFCSGGSGSMVGSLLSEGPLAATAAIIEVQTAPLSAFITTAVDFVKMDIEGSEHTVLEDLIKSDKIGAVKELVLEYHHHFSPGENKLGQFLSALELCGYGYHLKAPWKTPFTNAEQSQAMMIGAYRDSSLIAPRPA